MSAQHTSGWIDTDTLLASMREVSRDEFFAVINPLNVMPQPRGPYPYYSDWEMQDGSRRLIGRSRRENDGVQRRYALAKAGAA